MVLLYSPKKSEKKISQRNFSSTPAGFEAEIIDLDYQGLGVAKVNGKTWFIENALPQERVYVRVSEEKRQYGLGKASKILHQSLQRITPQCRYFPQCGGCQSQHISLALQREAKQKALFQQLSRLQKEIELMPMIVGQPWHYRRRVKLSLLYNDKTKQLELGFRQRQSQKIVEIDECEVIEPQLNALLPQLHCIFKQWSNPKQLGHIELVSADNTVAMLLRHKETLREKDRTLLLNLVQSQKIALFIQDDQDVHHICGELPAYQLKDGSWLQFDIRDFIQINRDLNLQMIDTAMNWLELQKTDHVLDLFCGMGNFTLPLSRKVKSAVGIEGVLAMVKKAQANGERNHCTNVQFYQADLDKPFIEQQWAKQKFNKILLDPPRSGAAFALNSLCQLQAEKILYVSCNPATLVRDTEILLSAGYKLQKVAMIDMFPHTGHLESISIFEKK